MNWYIHKLAKLQFYIVTSTYLAVACYYKLHHVFRKSMSVHVLTKEDHSFDVLYAIISVTKRNLEITKLLYVIKSVYELVSYQCIY